MTGAASEKFDHKSAFPLLYKSGRKDWTEVFVPSLRFLAFQGHGNPNLVTEYKLAVESLYTVAYTLKFALNKSGLPIGSVHTVELLEGRSLQILHLGSYDDEAPTLARLHDEIMPSLKVTFNGLHHEIYLGDPRRSAPEKLKTILRQPIKDAATD